MQEDMPDFYSWETPDFELTIEPSGSLVDYTDVVVSIQQGSQFLHLHKDDVSVKEDKIHIILTQEQAGRFAGDREAHIQVNVLYDDGTREATTWGVVWVRPNLYRKAMP